MSAQLPNRFVLVIILLSLGAPTSAAENWPMWRSDAQRSARTSNTLPEQFELLWSRNFQARKQTWDDPLNLDLMTFDRVFEPIVLDGRMFVGFNDQDKLVALDTARGQELWRFYAEAPIRLPPVGWEGKVYVCSDDGFLYCLDAESGRLIWKFRGAPNSQHALGNERLTSAWPARGGPVVFKGTVYFAASIWPFMGTFLYALNADSGELVWVNDQTGAQFIKQPHSAPSFAGVAPQGALVATEDLLIVPGGRSVPAVFDRHTGDLKYFEINAGGKGTGGSFVSADAHHFYVHTREKGTRAFDLSSGLKTAFTPNEPVHSNGLLFSAESVEGRDMVRMYDVRDEGLEARKPIWEIECSGQGDLIQAGDKLAAVGNGKVSIIRIPTDAEDFDSRAAIETTLELEGQVNRLLVADGKLFAVTTEGRISAYGVKAAGSEYSVTSDQSKRSSEQLASAPAQNWKLSTQELLSLGDAEGYAFWYGSTDSTTAWELACNSPFVQLAFVDSHEQQIQDLRTRLDDQGIYGRVTAHVSEATDFRAPKYVANVVFVAPDVVKSNAAISEIYQSVRPYGGVMILISEGETDIASRIQSLRLEQAEVEVFEGGLVIRRVGALPGSADWTHQYGDIANTIKSNDSRVKLPLGILWFGGSSNMDVLPRHGHGPPEQVVGGRLFIEGMNCLSARDVYTGRVLWKREFEDLGTYDVYYDETYENTPLNPQYNQVHIPGANGRGTNYVVTEDVVYLLNGGDCLMLDPASGEDMGKITLPEHDEGHRPEWGYLGVYQDVLLGGVGFADYRERYQLEFESDKGLKRSRAGFGSKSFDRAASRALIAFDRHSGSQLWQVEAKHSFWHNGIVAGGGRVFCLDKNPTQIEQAMLRRGRGLPDSYRIVGLNAKDGTVDWEVTDGIFGSWLGYSEEHDVLLQAGAQASDRLYAEVGQGMRVYNAANGELQWKNDTLKYAGPCILHHDLILTNANSYAESAGAFSLLSGKQKMVKNPLTGALNPWTITRAYGCNNIIASENLLTFRSGAAGYYDLLTDSGTGNLGGFKSGCTSNLVVANGVLNAPDYTRTCSCAYQNQTSLALVHMPEVEVWSINSLASQARGTEVDSLGINLGAPGDRRDQDGKLWLEYPVVAGDSPAVGVDFNDGARVFQQHSASVGREPRAWVAASGIEGLTELRVSLTLSKEYSLASGLPVAHEDDDAEENERGDVSLGSSDLELVNDGNDQTVGLRFTNINLEPGAKIGQAHIQFTCDEPSSIPTSLMIAGELSADAAPFEDESHGLSARTKSKAEVVWTPPAWSKPGEAGSAQRTPDLSAILQEIVDQPKWKSGNALALLFSGSGKRTAAARRGSEKDAAKLVVLADVADNGDSAVPIATYDLELVFANPRGSSEVRVFDVLVQGKLAAADVRIEPGSQRQSSPVVVQHIDNVEVGRELELRFVPKQGQAVLCGLALKRSN